uniref:Uncharacterized protein n=1 Tax=Cucumis sativus TaxID=3659 RepID=A0A0A0KXA4_CUCSA
MRRHIRRPPLPLSRRNFPFPSARKTVPRHSNQVRKFYKRRCSLDVLPEISRASPLPKSWASDLQHRRKRTCASSRRTRDVSLQSLGFWSTMASALLFLFSGRF